MSNRSCGGILLSLLLRIGFGMIVLGVIVLIMALAGGEPQDAEEVTGNSVNLVEMVYLLTSAVVGGPMTAAIILLAVGGAFVLIGLGFSMEANRPRQP